MRKLLYIVCLTLLLSCVKQGKENSPESRLEINAEIAQSPDTKAILEGENFKTGNSIGIFVYHSETSDVQEPSEMKNFSIYGARYKNIKAVYDERNVSKPWKFNFENTSTPFDDIYLLKPSISVFEEGLAVVAYAPWISNVANIYQIPFTLGGKSEDMVDLLWARQNTNNKQINPIDAGKNYKIIPDGNVQPVNFTFHHALSMLKISFRCRHEGSVMTITSITLRRNDSDGTQTKLPVSGQFNAMTGEVVDQVFGSYITYDYTDKTHSFQYSETGYEDVAMLICPQEYLNDDDYILEFKFNGQVLASKYKIKKSDVEGGFRPGEVYNFKFTLDNYIQFDGVEVSTDWIQSESNKAELKF